MKLILYYFSIPFWRAEVTRLVLYMNDIEFVDHRVSDTEKDQFKKNPDEKIIIFSFFRGTIDYLSKRLGEEGFPSTILKGGMRKSRFPKIGFL